MNFVAHYYIDSHLDNGLFVVGVSTPDLVPVYQPRFRLRKRLVEKKLLEPHTEEFSYFTQGILRHFEADDIFHSAPFFQYENSYLIELIKDFFPHGEVKRSFFVAHILFELVLDRVLVLDDPTVLDAYYRHWQSVDLYEISSMTGSLFENGLSDLEGYQGYLNKFATRKYLYGLEEWSELIYVFRRIMQRVKVGDKSYVNSPRFLEMLETYEKHLAPRVPTYMDEMREKMSQPALP